MRKMYSQEQLEALIVKVLEEKFNMEINSVGALEFNVPVVFDEAVTMLLPTEQPEDAETLWNDNNTVKITSE